MANIDYQEAKREIVKIFQAENGGGRKIVFWYDAPANFKDDVTSDNFDVCRVLLCSHNEFAIKKIIEQEDTDSNILIYIPYEKPSDAENWLLDILMYSEEYYADTVALTMRHLGISNSDLRKIVERHIKFFDSAQRTKKLSSYVMINDDLKGSDLLLAMMCVIVKAETRSLESVLAELIFDGNEQTKYKELKRLGFEDFLWEEISNEYNYEGDQKIEILAKRFLFTAMLEQNVEIDPMPSFYKQYVIDGQGRVDARFFVNNIKQDSRYKVLQFNIGADLKIEGLLVGRDVSLFEESDIFEAIDFYIIKQTADSLRNGGLDYERFERIINSRANSIWYQEHESEYAFLMAAICLFKLLETNVENGLTAVEYIKKYTSDYFKIDKNYRHAVYNYNLIHNPIEEIETLMERVEFLYGEKYLGTLGREYSTAISQQEKWEFFGVQNSSNFYQMLQKFQFKKLFVIISDGLRYEIGQEIYEEIKSEAGLRGNVSLDYAISPLPSETRFGMAALLPHNDISYTDGNVLIDGQTTNGIPARNKILQSKNSSYAAIDYQEICGFSRDELRSYMADKSLVYIYHNVIDNAGEHNERRVFDVAQNAISEIVALIKKLYNNLQISNFFITADHGFLYRRNTLLESQKYSNIVSKKPIEASKRYVITDDELIQVPYTSEFDLLGKDEHKVIVPFGYDIFKTQGAGVQYVHGGASLQETIVPIVHISELNAKKGEKLSRPVGVRLKSIVRKITNRSFALDFEQYEKVEDKVQPITCVTYFVDEEGNKVSGEYHFTANSSCDDISQRVTRIRFTLKNIEFDRAKRYFLMLCDEENLGEYIEKEQFTIDILGFKIF